MPNFDELLNTPVDNIQAPKPVPMGEYQLKVTDHEFGESSVKGTPYVQYNFSITAPGDDVDEEMLEEVDWKNKRLRARFYLTENAMFMLKNFLSAADVEMEGKTLKEAIPEAIGAEVIGSVSVQQGQNGDYNTEVSNIQPAE